VLLPARVLLAILSVATLILTINSGDGWYGRDRMAGTLAALGLAVAACALRPERQWRLPAALGWLLLCGIGIAEAVLFACTSRIFGRKHLLYGAAALTAALIVFVGRRRLRSLPALLVAALGLLLSGFAIFQTSLWYVERESARQAVDFLAGAGFLLTTTLVLDLTAPQERRRGFGLRLALLFLAGLGLRGAAVMASPDPIIDAYSWLTHAPEHVLHGVNPYTAEYPSPYTTERAVQHGMASVASAEPVYARYPAYPPLPILIALPFSAGRLDVRYANVVCDVIAALALFLAARQRGRPLIGALLAGTYLNLPHVPFLMENCWYEPMLAALLGFGLLLIERGSSAGYVVLGLGLTGKQFGVPLLAPLLRSRGRQWWKVLAGVGLALAAVTIPFFWWAPHDFLDIVLFSHLARPVVTNSMTLHSACHDLLGTDLPSIALWVPAALLIGWVAWKTPRDGAEAAWWTGTALLIFFLFHAQGFINYYYLCEYLMLLGIAALAPEEDRAAQLGSALPEPTSASAVAA
jgi:hypothetical protein